LPLQNRSIILAFRALRNTGLVLSLGLTALAAYQGIRDAMEPQPGGRGGGAGHLDASGPREVVYCHQCDHEWYRDEHGLVCPQCEGEITEIITPSSDPRPLHEAPLPSNPPAAIHPRLPNNPWGVQDDSDPEEADIEEHISHGPGGSVHFSRVIRSSGPTFSTFTTGRMPRNFRQQSNDPDHVMQDFQHMIAGIAGPGFVPGRAGRSGPETLFTQGPQGGFAFGTPRSAGPSIVGGRFTFTTNGALRPRDVDGAQPGGSPVDELQTYAPSPNSPDGRNLYVISFRGPPDSISRLLGTLFGPQGDAPGGFGGPANRGLPNGLQGLFAAMLNPANARSGDAVYSQEALDQIISQLMEQHPTSNAPGPASADAISALPKKLLDLKELGAEGKAECSVCMDDVFVGTEVVVLPCSHWFHEACATAWLSEHNTCPICRKGITPDSASPSSSGGRRSSRNSPNPREGFRTRRMSSNTFRNSRNTERLDAIRNAGGRVETPSDDRAGSGSTASRWTTFGGNERQEGDLMPSMNMPGSFETSGSGGGRDRDTELRENRRRTSGSDRSRDSRRSSNSGGGSGSGGAIGWIRDRFGGRRHD